MSRSNYYKQRKSISAENPSDIEKIVIKCFCDHNGNYGRIRIQKALALKGIRISQFQIRKILVKHGLVAKSGRKKRHYANKPTEKQYLEENLIYHKTDVTQINYLWCSDITELTCARNGKLFVCGVIDVASRRLVGWSIGRNQIKELVMKAFRMAVGRNPVRPEGAVFHSDRGCQYTSMDMKKLVESSGFRKSMSRPGTPHDNQPIESFWRTLEVEMPDIGHLNFEDASRSIIAYIELYYNSVRFHSSLDYLPPNTFFSLSSVLFS